MVDGIRDVDIIRESAFFDGVWYLAKYLDVGMLGMDPAEHFADLGWRIGRDPGPDFDVKGYLEANPDVRASGMNPLVHFVRYGNQEGRAARPVKIVPKPAKVVS